MPTLKKVSLALAVAAMFAAGPVTASNPFGFTPGQGLGTACGTPAGANNPHCNPGNGGGGEIQPMPVGVGVGIGQGGAGGAGGNASVGNISNRNHNTNLNTAHGGHSSAGAVSGSVSGATGGSASASGGNAFSEGSSANASNSMGDINIQVGNPDEDRSLTRSFDTIDQNINYSGRYDVRNVPDAYAPNLGATSPCMGSTSLGGSGVGFGFSAGTTWHDKDCTIRETARSFAGMGMNTDAIAILCSSDYSAAAPSCVAYREDQTAGLVAAYGPTGERPTSGFRYDPRSGDRMCAWEPILASRNNLPICP